MKSCTFLFFTEHHSLYLMYSLDQIKVFVGKLRLGVFNGREQRGLRERVTQNLVSTRGAG